MAKLLEIEGIGKTFALKFEALGLKTTTALLKRASTLKGRRELAQALEVSEKRLLKWVNRADLMRVKGVGSQFSDLLEEAGVDTVKELRNRVPQNLHAKMLEVNARRNLARRDPTLEEVRSWVAVARSLPVVVTHSAKAERQLAHQRQRAKQKLEAKTLAL
jgi:nucleotidyltransferase/DNA polymerase involved in DNA repair